MRSLLLLLVVLIPSLGFAASSSQSGMERMRIGGFYGYGSLPAGDVNNYINQTVAVPKWNNLTNTWSYGGEFGYMIHPRWELELSYDVQTASNPINTTAPVVTNAGVQLTMNAGFAGLNYLLLSHGNFIFKIGAFAGYPTYAHASIVNSSRTEYDSAFAPIYQGKATAEIMVGKFIGLFAEGGYQLATLNALSNGSTNLKQSNGSNVNFDFSGWRAKAGLNFHF